MKKILVIDVPMIYDSRRKLLCNLCNKCPIWNHERCYCQYDFNTKAKRCPLKPMPEKEIHDPMATPLSYPSGYVDGRNSVIKEILGETE